MFPTWVPASYLPTSQEMLPLDGLNLLSERTSEAYAAAFATMADVTAAPSAGFFWHGVWAQVKQSS